MDISFIDLARDVSSQLRELGASEREIDWSSGGYVHNWKTHVARWDRERWAGLSDEARGLICVVAEACANAEEWD